MGYDVYITRASDWLDRETFPIPEKEWMIVVQSDPSLQISKEDYFDRTTKEGNIERLRPVCWKQHPDSVPFWYMDGAIEVKSPDDSTIQKMIEIAKKLNARVIGEDGEEYA